MKFSPLSTPSVVEAAVPAAFSGIKQAADTAASTPWNVKEAGFTLVELMVSTAIIGLIMIVLVQMTNQTSRTWRGATEKIEKFQEARDGFEAMTRRLSQATLNTYWDYLDKNGLPRDKNVQDAAFKTFIPFMYGRASDLRFISGPMSTPVAVGVTALGVDRIRPTHGIFFQAPFGVVNTGDAQHSNADFGVMNNLLNTWGYFVEADQDPSLPGFLDPSINRSAHVPRRWRSRLMEFMLPAEQMELYDFSGTSPKWFQNFIPMGTGRPVHAIAENVLALIILPKLSNADQDSLNQTYAGSAVPLSPRYSYDSTVTVNAGGYNGTISGLAAALNPKNQLPPVVSVTMLAVDERSAERLFDKYCTPYNADGSGGPNHLSPSTTDATMGLSTILGAQYSTLFTNSVTLEVPITGDLAILEAALTQAKVTYRVFTTNVTIRGAKWSRSQTK